MTDKPSPGAVIPKSCSDGYEEHVSSRNYSSVSANQRSQQQRSPEGSQDRRESRKQHPEFRMGARPPSAISGAAKIAFAALCHLPAPLLVLSDLKTVIFANHAMEQILESDTTDAATSFSADECDEGVTATDYLQGKSLTQLGIQIVQEGQQRWVGWEGFLDGLADERDQGPSTGTEARKSRDSGGSTFEDNALSQSPGRWRSDPIASKKQRLSQIRSQALTAEVEVNVKLPSSHVLIDDNHPGSGRYSSNSNELTKAKMAISVWTLENQRYFTLTFASVSDPLLSSTLSQPEKRSLADPLGEKSTNSTPVLSSPRIPFCCPVCGSSTAITPSSTGLLPSIASAPARIALSVSDVTKIPSVLDKMNCMKGAMIDSMEMPVLAMWKDESLAIPNEAACKLMHQVTDPPTVDAHRLLAQFRIYTEDFGRQLDPDEYPIVQLCRSQKPFRGLKVGIIDSKHQRKRFDVSGETIIDETTGEFMAGIILLTDGTDYTETIRNQVELDHRQFQLICDTIPQMLWMTDLGGIHEWFSKRWYDYTGLSVENSLGENWQYAFHPDDITNASQKWRHSLHTGEEYMTEYRCKRFDGAWRWMLGRALPLRDAKSGKITKWFGTCTDIHDLVEARQEAKRTREQLLNVIKHAHVTVWTVDCNRILTFLEGKLMWDEDSDCEEASVGKNVFEVFGRHKGKEHVPLYKEPIDRILDGEDSERISEHYIDGNKRWFRTRFVPMFGTQRPSGGSATNYIEGVIGVSMDVTELKEREAELQSREKENLRLHSAEIAAKEASRLKSQFLANMSHEIRTPIAGVIGMSELLIDTELDENQRECAENIQRSANGLLTVINDILDLSKVESGRLDIEEVQFSLSVVIRDVNKMLSFAAERKHLAFESNIQLGSPEDLIVMGDPGRVRQILTNLLTNSIKFTSRGSVMLEAAIKEETNDTVEVAFTVEDTGIGVEEEVRKRLFKPFSQADSSTARRFGGTGLGLTICKNLVDLMHGQISLDSTIGIGTRATFSIPFHKPQFRGGPSPLVNLESLPSRLQSELSLSSCASDHDHGSVTRPQISSNTTGRGKSVMKQQIKSSTLDFLSQSPYSEGPLALERARTHVLVVEDNAINQQIALKTIKKFGFSVNAVWNGKEALDYLLEVPSADHPKPDIILMDVQMPILDGYRATHLIRHHSPYTRIEGLRAVPIIAMTASAIQGDKEKCKEAGMNDYLAKPVKAKTLEAMLQKWAIRRREMLGESLDLSPTDLENTCTDPEASTHEFNPSPGCTPSENNNRSRAQSISDLPWADSEGNRDMQRCEAEEKAISLRDDKLLAASLGYSHTRKHVSPSRMTSMRPDSPTKALTEENMGILDREHDGLPATNLRVPNAARGSSYEHSSMQPGSRDSSPPSSTVGSLNGAMMKEGKSWGHITRGRLMRNDSDRSQATVTESTARELYMGK